MLSECENVDMLSYHVESLERMSSLFRILRRTNRGLSILECGLDQNELRVDIGIGVPLDHSLSDCVRDLLFPPEPERVLSGVSRIITGALISGGCVHIHKIFVYEPRLEVG